MKEKEKDLNSAKNLGLTSYHAKIQNALEKSLALKEEALATLIELQEARSEEPDEGEAPSD